MSSSNFLATDVVFVGLIVIAIFAFVFTAEMRFWGIGSYPGRASSNSRDPGLQGGR